MLAARENMHGGRKGQPMNSNIAVTRIMPSTNGGPVKAYADVRLDSEVGSLHIRGCSVIESDGKPAWVGLPQRAGKNGKKYFPVIEAEGALRELIVSAILDAYSEMKERLAS